MPRMLRMLPVAGTTPLVVTTDDGTMFHCQPHEVEAEESDGAAPAGQRWILIDTQRVPHVGPAYDSSAGPQALQRIFNDWWASRAARGDA